ncbi:MAG: ribosome-binding factor A [Candidatus Andersenbacteria bacterium]
MLATVTRVECSVDLRHATVSISVLPLHRTLGARCACSRTRLNALQRQINSRLSMRPVPRLRFVPDKGEQHAHMEQIFVANRREQPREPVQP